MSATTRGVGELLLAGAAVAARAERVLLGLGGSATMDGGLGLARALGWRCLDDAGRPVAGGARGLLDLAALRAPERPPALPGAITALADVSNPLLGPNGAAAVFGPQKGAAPRQIAAVERGLERLARLLERETGAGVAELPGAGAAGGLGAAAAGFLGAELVPGSDWILDALDFDGLLARARLVVTGEGALDAQSGMGKIVGGVLARARARGVPALVVAGRVEGHAGSGVLALSGEGRTLDADGVAELARRGVAQLLDSSPLP